MTDSYSPRRSPFAVWHWPRWVWCVIVLLMPVFYFLSMAPVTYAVGWVFAYADFRELPAFNRYVVAFYLPAHWLKDHFWLAREINKWELDVLLKIFGSL